MEVVTKCECLRQYQTLCAGVQLYTVQANRYYLHKIIIILSVILHEKIGQSKENLTNP